MSTLRASAANPILIIDDNDTKRYANATTLRAAGYTVREAATGKDGLWMAMQAVPSLILLDILLPDISGFEVCRVIKTNAATAAVPVLHLSAHYTKSADMQEGLRLADGYLTGIVEPEVLLATIKALLRTSQSEQAATALARRWETTFNAIRDGVVVLDAAGAVVQCNYAALKMLDAEATAGASLDAVVTAVMGPEAAAAARAARTAAATGVAEVPVDDRWLAFAASPVLNELGRAVGAVQVIQDVTERKSAELERDQLLARERVARVEAERLLTTAQAANRIKDEFLATLSHELRTPLNAMLGWSRILLSRTMHDAETRRGLETIARNARAQAQLIDDLLDMSQIVSGKVRVEAQRLELAPIVEAAVESVMPSAEAKSIVIRRAIDREAGPVLGDPSRLQQVMWNLLINAVKFTPSGGSIDVGVRRTGADAEIVVHDSGVGIQEDFLPHLFERFRQADSSITRKFGGLGLGLSIVKQLVELHGGTVDAESGGAGRGATFIVRLPIRARGEVGAPSRETPMSAPPSAPRVTLVSLAGLKILVVDDEADARDLLQMVLEEAHAEVIVAASAADGLALVQSAAPDVIVSDIGMPERDGYQLIRDVRSLDPSRGGRTPAVALTAFARAEDRSCAVLAGYQLHVPKPIEPHELVAAVKSVAAQGRPLEGAADVGAEGRSSDGSL
jgi:signal transduction histidine kinase